MADVHLDGDMRLTHGYHMHQSVQEMVNSKSLAKLSMMKPQINVTNVVNISRHDKEKLCHDKSKNDICDKFTFKWFLKYYESDPRSITHGLSEQFVTLQEDTSNGNNIPKQVNYNYDVTYYIWPFMFYSSSTKNIFPDAQTGKPTRYGTLKGIAEKLDYFLDLGVKNIMIGPITKCWEGGMDLYNINRYQTIDWSTTQPQLGKPRDVYKLCREAHCKGLKVLQDITFNHCSYQHPFYLKALGYGNKKEQEKYLRWFLIESFTPDGSINNDPFDPNGPYAAYVENLLHIKYGRSLPFFNTVPSTWDTMPTLFMQLTDDPNKANSLQSNLVPSGSKLNGLWIMNFPSAVNLIQLNWIEQPGDMYDYFVNIMKYWLSLGMDGFRWDVAQSAYDYQGSGYNETLFKTITKDLIAFKPNTIIFAEGNYISPLVAPYTIGAMLNMYMINVRYDPFVSALPLIPSLVEQYQKYWNRTVSMPLVGNQDFGRILSLFQYQPPDFNPYTNLTVQEREVRNIAYYTLLLCSPGSPIIYYGEELAEIGGMYAQCRDYFKWSQEQYNNGICDTYNFNNIYPQQTRGDGKINPADPSDPTTPLNYPITRGLDLQIDDPKSSYNQVKQLIRVRSQYSYMSKGDIRELTDDLANKINLVIGNPASTLIKFAKYYNGSYAYIIINQDKNNSGNTAIITFDSLTLETVPYLQIPLNILFTNGTVIAEAQVPPASPQNQVNLAPWEVLVIGYTNNA
jgi:glycosidase